MINELEKIYGTFESALARSKKLEEDLKINPHKYRVLSGDRPTGELHVGHFFGSLQNRIKLQSLGVETFILIADYQVLTDKLSSDKISESVRKLVIDYLAIGLDPEKHNNTHIFLHSYVPELNQLLVPFLTLVSNAELGRNPTVKEEISVSIIKNINAGMYVYPVHQAADILSVKANVVPVGKDQLPHLEITRMIARRFNNKFAKNKPVFPEPIALLSEAPIILGLDGEQKMSKSRNNAITLSATADETANLIKRAKTDSERFITYDPNKRPEVSNLLRIASLATGKTPERIAEEIGEGGAGMLKKIVTESLNEFFAPIRKRRKELEHNKDHIIKVLEKGNARAREEATKTLDEVRTVMNMSIY